MEGTSPGTGGERVELARVEGELVDAEFEPMNVEGELKRIDESTRSLGVHQMKFAKILDQVAALAQEQQKAIQRLERTVASLVEKLVTANLAIRRIDALESALNQRVRGVEATSHENDHVARAVREEHGHRLTEIERRIDSQAQMVQAHELALGVKE